MYTYLQHYGRYSQCTSVLSCSYKLETEYYNSLPLEIKYNLLYVEICGHPAYLMEHWGHILTDCLVHSTDVCFLLMSAVLCVLRI